MNYRHAFHAGNFADVVKHVALVSVLQSLRKKEAPFAVVDMHAGGGLYDLEGDAAQRTKEWTGGIGRLRDVGDGPPALLSYLETVRSFGPASYPGSALIIATFLRAQDRFVAIEKHPEEQARLAQTLKPFARVRTLAGDAYERLGALLPPPERRALILIDPPYEAPDEFARTALAFAKAYRRFETGIYLLWFPIKSSGEADRFMGEILATGVRKLLRLDIDIAPGGKSRDERLTRAGLAVVNAPFGFAKEMGEIFSLLEPLLGEPNARAATRIVTLAGET